MTICAAHFRVLCSISDCREERLNDVSGELPNDTAGENSGLLLEGEGVLLGGL